MEKIILVEDIENAKDKTLYFEFNEKIEGMDCVEPIKAQLCAKSLGEFIEVSGHVSGKIKLVCDLCLDEFVYELDYELEEVFAKGTLLGDIEESGQEFELKDGQFVTDLNGSNEIDIYDLMYQSVIINTPNKKVCGINCKGKDFISEDEVLDPRLEIFDKIKINPTK